MENGSRKFLENDNKDGLELVLLIFIVGIVLLRPIGCGSASNPGRWPSPGGSPSIDHESALVEMLEDQAVSSGIQVDQFSIVYWWQRDRIPVGIGGETVAAESLVRVDYLNSAGQPFQQNWIFLKWAGKTPYCVDVLGDNLVPAEYRR